MPSKQKTDIAELNESPVIQQQCWKEQSLWSKRSPQKLQSPTNCIPEVEKEWEN